MRGFHKIGELGSSLRNASRESQDPLERYIKGHGGSIPLNTVIIETPAAHAEVEGDVGIVVQKAFEITRASPQGGGS